MALYRLLVPIQRCRENVNLFIFVIVLGFFSLCQNVYPFNQNT